MSCIDLRVLDLYTTKQPSHLLETKVLDITISMDENVYINSTIDPTVFESISGKFQPHQRECRHIFPFLLAS